MNSTEAKEMTEFGMWTKINSSIKDLIIDACNAGEFEINISSKIIEQITIPIAIKVDNDL